MSARDDLLHAQIAVEAWVCRMFGPQAMATRERAMRLAEEAIELAQAEGIGADDLHRLVDHVLAKPAGKAPQEAGGVGVCLLAWAAGAKQSLWPLIDDEIIRIHGKTKEHFLSRHRIKSDAGIAREADQ